MTFSILAHDEKTGTYGGAAATGSLCVGGWVLRGHAESGMSASQGTAPSTLWGEAALTRMRAGDSASAVVEALTSADPGRAHRQLATLDLAGTTGHFTGAESVPACGAVTARGVVVSGNMLTGLSVIEAILDAYLGAEGSLPDRLLQALVAGGAAGGDSRGLLSAAILCVSRDAPPLTLRVDRSHTPIADLQALYRASQADPYHGWTAVVPVLADPHRAPTPQDFARWEREAEERARAPSPIAQ